MAFQQIDTGYKPEFGLGALYQGFNAGNADQSAELEIIKQFLANQHSQVQNPLDEQTTAQNLLANHYKTDPRYQTGMTNMIEGQGYSNLAAGQTASTLQPFKEQAGRRELENQFQNEDLQNQIYQLDQRMGTEPNPLTRFAMKQERDRITRALRESPKFTGQRELKETGTDSAEYIAELRAELARRLAAEKVSTKGVGDPKTAQETMQRILAKKRRGEQLTQEDVDVYNQANETFNAAIATKIQPGTMLNPTIAPEVLQPKPVQVQSPGLTSEGQKPSLPTGWTLK
jgi:disulfide oxidoreductase YuzD